MSDRKVLLVPLVHGVVEFCGDEVLSIRSTDGRTDLSRGQIVGRHPDRGDAVLVLDIQDLADALRDGDDDLVEVDLNGSVVKLTSKAVVMQLASGREVSLPKRFVNASVDEFVREVRIPRWLALDRGL